MLHLIPIILLITSWSQHAYSLNQCESILFSPNKNKEINSLIGLITNYNQNCHLNDDIQMENNTNICYSYSVCEAFYDYEATPHPLYTSLIYTLHNYDNDIAYGFETDALKLISTLPEICDHKKFNTALGLGTGSFFDETVRKINAPLTLTNEYVKNNFEIFTKDFIEKKFDIAPESEDYMTFIKGVNREYQDLLTLDNFKNFDQKILYQFSLMYFLCKQTDSMVKNPMYGSQVEYERYQDFNSTNIDEHINFKKTSYQKNTLPDYLSVDLNLIYPDSNYDVKKPALHTMTLVGQYQNTEGECLVILKDSNPHSYPQKCKTENLPTAVQNGLYYAHFESATQSCFYSFKKSSLLKNENQLLRDYYRVKSQ